LAALAPLTVLAVGKADGSDRENARTYELVNTSESGSRNLSLNLYNVKVGEITELHLDLYYSFKEKSARQDFGFCLAEKDTEKWDCFVVK
jgi:hypothetical protein